MKIIKPFMTSSVLIALITGAYNFGCYKTVAEKDREMKEKEINLDWENKERVHNIEIERD